MIALFLFVGACGKSAQIPLYVWLPDAMEGPTPVSALIHAATMVTAGVYMVARSSAIYAHAPKAMIVVAVIGAAHRDLRRHDRASCRTTSSACWPTRRSASSATCSWPAAWAPSRAGVFHLMTHAFFKALLFLGSGSVIHGMSGEQDMRQHGRPARTQHAVDAPHDARSAASPSRASRPWPASSPRTRSCGRPSRSAATGACVWAIGLRGRGPDRLLHVPAVPPDVQRRVPRAPTSRTHHVHESPASMIVPLQVLAVGSIAGRLPRHPRRARPPAPHPERLRALPGAGVRARAPRAGRGLHAPPPRRTRMEFALMGAAWPWPSSASSWPGCFFQRHPAIPERLAASARAGLHRLLLEQVLRGRALRRGCSCAGAALGGGNALHAVDRFVDRRRRRRGAARPRA